jgi:hypothetical protein
VTALLEVLGAAVVTLDGDVSSASSTYNFPKSNPFLFILAL